MIVSPAVLAHDMSAPAGDALMGIWGSPFFLLDECTRRHSKNWKTVKLRQRSISSIREKAKSLKHVKLRVDT